ncbi:MAG: hypothetical protein HY645_13375 [Acidobacteria bacterium]|nr:hypothetical protein [Acidobacteriota bacterium]
MSNVPTTVNQEKLEEWKQRLPRRLHLFMENFYDTCEVYDPAVSYLNYLEDIRLYSLTTAAYREHTSELKKAFYDITGWQPGRDD